MSSATVKIVQCFVGCGKGTGLALTSHCWERDLTWNIAGKFAVKTTTDGDGI